MKGVPAGVRMGQPWLLGTPGMERGDASGGAEHHVAFTGGTFDPKESSEEITF